MLKFLMFFVFLQSCLESQFKQDRYTIKNTGGSVELSVMTFNILSSLDLGSQNKGYSVWKDRAPGVFALLNHIKADVVAIHESTPAQIEEFRDRMGDAYTVIDFESYTSDAVILFDRKKFELIERGYWPLEEILGEKGIYLRRVAVWASLRQPDTRREIFFVSLHLDNRAVKDEEVKKLRTYLQKQISTGAPVFVCGDFNLTPETTSFKYLNDRGLKDSYLPQILEPGETKKEPFTYSVLEPKSRIDHILYAGTDVTPLTWKVLPGGDKDRLPLSDHFPVLARFRIHAHH